ncbi:hypothetical protein [Enemella evansiae]|nr:hypothetical protein [Enemella evansiae]
MAEITLHRGDITTDADADAIVNAACWAVATPGTPRSPAPAGCR